MPKVAIVRAKTDYSDVEEAVFEALELLGGLPGVATGKTVLLKPNMLEMRGGESGATTHKLVTGALVKAVKASRADVVVGDSSGLRFHGSSERVLTGTGLREHCESLGARVVSFDSVKPLEVEIAGARVLKKAYLASPALESDVVITIPKLKTHNLTVFSGAVKNLFGALPGGQKTIAHRLGATPERFADLLVDLLSAIKPRFALMDAVVGLGGLWQTETDRILAGRIIAGADSVAVDAVACSLLGLEPLQVPMLRLAQERGLGVADLREIEVVGDLERPEIAGRSSGLAGALLRRLLLGGAAKFLKPQEPRIMADLCTKCGHCLKVCPTEVISLNRERPTFDLSRCIRCFCCHELCPEHAVTIDRGFLGRRIFG